MTEESSIVKSTLWNLAQFTIGKSVVSNDADPENGQTDSSVPSGLNSYVKSKIVLNVGGTRHETLCHTLNRFPHTRLGRLVNALKSIGTSSDANACAELKTFCDDFDLSTNEFFFERGSRSFMAVIDFYRTGRLHLSDDVCVISYYDDLVYWGLSENYLDACCLNRYHEKKESILDGMKKEMDMLHLEKENFTDKHCLPDLRQKLWTLFEEPHSSPAARIVNMINIGFILLSSMTLTLSTIDGIGCVTDKVQNLTATGDTHTNQLECHEPLSIFIIEALCVVWFSMDYVTRLFAAPNKCDFLKRFLNTIDLIAILPFYISLILEVFFVGQIGDLKSIRKATEVFRVLRIMRILKLARHSTGLQSLGSTLKRSYKELSMLLMFLGIFVLLFSSLIYFAEKDSNGAQFRSIAHAFWWTSITMTTVGYGDMYPISIIGKLIGSVCAICGVLVIALPIPIIVNNFSELYQEQLRREKMMKRQQWIDAQQKNRSDGSIDAEETFHVNSMKSNETTVLANRIAQMEPKRSSRPSINGIRRTSHVSTSSNVILEQQENQVHESLLNENDTPKDGEKRFLI